DVVAIATFNMHDLDRAVIAARNETLIIAIAAAERGGTAYFGDVIIARAGINFVIRSGAMERVIVVCAQNDGQAARCQRRLGARTWRVGDGLKSNYRGATKIVVAVQYKAADLCRDRTFQNNYFELQSYCLNMLP